MKNQTCCFSGHRKIPAGKHDEIKTKLQQTIIELINEGVSVFYAGGALGFDTMAAIAVLKLKKAYPKIKLNLVLPHWEQAEKWSAEDKEKYAIIRVKADEVIYTSWIYYSGCMQKRNRHMVKNSDFCICYLERDKGGTAYTVKHAKEKGLRIINVANKLNQ